MALFVLLLFQAHQLVMQERKDAASLSLVFSCALCAIHGVSLCSCVCVRALRGLGKPLQRCACDALLTCGTGTETWAPPHIHTYTHTHMQTVEGRTDIVSHDVATIHPTHFVCDLLLFLLLPFCHFVLLAFCTLTVLKWSSCSSSSPYSDRVRLDRKVYPALATMCE